MGSRASTLVLVWFATAASPASAGNISIRTEVSATVKDGALAVTLRVANSGDEAARTVVAGARFGGQTVQGTPRETLAPGEPMEVSFQLRWNTATPGQWPLTTIVDYADANSHPFQAIQVALVSSTEAAPALVSIVDVDATPVTTSGMVRTRLKSLSGVPRQVRVEWVVPRGLEVDTPVAHCNSIRGRTRT